MATSKATSNMNQPYPALSPTKWLAIKDWITETTRVRFKIRQVYFIVNKKKKRLKIYQPYKIYDVIFKRKFP